MTNMLTYAQVIALLLVCFLIIYHFHRRRSIQSPILYDWPFFGMVPSMLFHFKYLHEHMTQNLKQRGCTANYRGPWFTKLNYLITCDPINVRHMLSKNSDNYVRGPEFREKMDIFGDGIIASDSETWKYRRTLLHSLLKDIEFEKLCEKAIHRKIESGLLHILDDIIVGSEQGIVDLQEIFKRLNFDYFCSFLLGHDPQYLAIEFPKFTFGNNIADAEKITFTRHSKPKSLWKLQRFLQVGLEKKLATAIKAVDQFFYQQIASKRENQESEKESLAQADDVLTCLMREDKRKNRVHDDKFLRDTLANLFLAGRETLTSALTWFFWFIATHPSVEVKIIEEIKEKIVTKGKNPSFLGIDEMKGLVYLHGAICESMRLFPPLPFEFRQAIKYDVLPSGHRVNPNTMIILSFYSMGRLEESWGKDYLEYKPERWISETRDIVHVPFHKFATFGAGPRICLGRNMSFMTLKIVASAILWNYHVEVVKDHRAYPTKSIVTMMKHGLKVKLAKRK